jgi:hypothetical protein
VPRDGSGPLCPVGDTRRSQGPRCRRPVERDAGLCDHDLRSRIVWCVWCVYSALSMAKPPRRHRLVMRGRCRTEGCHAMWLSPAPNACWRSGPPERLRAVGRWRSRPAGAPARASRHQPAVAPPPGHLHSSSALRSAWRRSWRPDRPAPFGRGGLAHPLTSSDRSAIRHRPEQSKLNNPTQEHVRRQACQSTIGPLVTETLHATFPRSQAVPDVSRRNHRCGVRIRPGRPCLAGRTGRPLMMTAGRALPKHGQPRIESDNHEKSEHR